MTKFKDWPDATISLLVGGTPCQSFSVAGLREGLADPRGNLMLTFLGIADKYRPEWLVWENVPGVLSSGGGADFATFLGALGELGYGFAYRILDAQYFGVAQRRRRVFVVANARSWQRAAAVLFERHSLSGDSAPSRKTGKVTPAISASGTGVSRTGFNSETEFYIPTDVAKTIVHTNNNLSSTLQAQNKMAVALGEPVPYDFFQITAPVNSQNRSPGDPCHTLARDNAAHATIMQSIAIQGTLIGRSENAGPNGIGVDEIGSMFTLTKTDIHAVAFSCSEVGPTIGSSGPPYSRTGNERVESDALAIQNMQVRRLTPTECERLQGFPDGYTAITYKKKPAADGPRYKALGNSMAVPVMAWIGKRIQTLIDELP